MAPIRPAHKRGTGGLQEGCWCAADGCASATACTAVGGAALATLAEVWDGTSWTIQPTANPNPMQGSGLEGVSCVLASACTAVGGYNAGNSTYLTLAEAWNGTGWTLQSTPSPSPIQDNRLDGVACVSASACIAVGRYATAGITYALAPEAWDGTSWTAQTATTPPGASSIALSPTVSCTAATRCTAVGTFFNSVGASRPFAERYS
jgi:hypothetical protein